MLTPEELLSGLKISRHLFPGHWPGTGRGLLTLLEVSVVRRLFYLPVLSRTLPESMLSPPRVLFRMPIALMPLSMPLRVFPVIVPSTAP